MTEPQDNPQLATFGGGCFWCLEAMYDQLSGVHNVQSGYAGGFVENPTYKAICSGETGHAEVVQIEYDPSKIEYVELAKIFFTIHNPTTLNRQGNDVGTQYRSVVFYHNAFQKYVIEEIIKYLEAEQVWENIVTQIEPFSTFYRAESEHDDYFLRNPENQYCQAVINPKLQKFRELYREQLKANGG